jgi:hypothetical protein
MKISRPGNCLVLGLSMMLSGTLHAKASAAALTFQVTSRSDAFDGAVFASVGVYEQVTAIAHMKIDPGAPTNRGIVDLEGAPREADGMVHYDVDVQILRPRDSTKAKRVMVYDVVNRGNKTISAMRSASAQGANAGMVFLAQRGYTIVWSGWQGDISANSLIGARFPVATDRGRPIVGRITSETIFDAPTGERIALPYPAASVDPSSARLTVLQRTGDPEESIAPGDWHFEDDAHVTLKRPSNMDAGAVYRFSYLARDPKVMGLGFAAVREIISFLRHSSAEQGNPLAQIGTAGCERSAQGACVNPAGGVFSSAVAFGASQSGRFLRDFLWQGFNRDMTGGRVFDGMFALVAGARRTFTNMRFAEPGRFSRQHEDHDVPGFDFPFTYGALRDPVTGKTDGILSRCQRDETCPKLFHVDTSAEFWQAGASLVGTGGTEKDVVFPKNVRVYMIAGGAHAPGMTIAACQSPANPLNYTPVVHALLINLIDWTTGSRDPPANRWPRVADGEVRHLEALQTPDLQSIGISWPKVVNQPIVSGGTRKWPVLVPKVDADGNDVPGIRIPEMAAPSGTYLGWNLRKAGFGAGDLCSLFGSYLPFASDSGRGSDPRLSLGDRYGSTSRDERLHAAVEELSRDRLLLTEDAGPMSKP